MGQCHRDLCRSAVWPQAYVTHTLCESNSTGVGRTDYFNVISFFTSGYVQIGPDRHLQLGHTAERETGHVTRPPSGHRITYICLTAMHCGHSHGPSLKQTVVSAQHWIWDTLSQGWGTFSCWKAALI
jgi:hypothetical protein